MTARSFVFVVAVIAVAWRLVGLTDWPSQTYPTLQYESALAARALHIDLSHPDPDPRAWREAVGNEFFVSPPVLPGMVAIVYRATGEEPPWVARCFTIAFWLLAGAAIHRTTARLTGSNWAAAAGFIWFVLCPFGMVMSRSFQTESLLAFALACGILLLSKPMSSLSWRRTLLLGLACGAIGFIKPGVLFAPLLGGFAAVLLPRCVPGRALQKLAHLAVFSVLLVLPGSVYALGLLQSHAGRIMPELLGEAWYYQGIDFNIREVIGPAIWLGLLGVAMAARQRVLLPAGLLVGHFATLAIFTYHAATHDYYQVPLLVIVAVAIGWPVAAVERICRRKDFLRSRAARVAAALALVSGIAAFLFVGRDPEIGPFRWTSENRAALTRESDERDRRAHRAKEIRRIIGVESRVVELTEQYGYPLRFHGWLQTSRWPTIEERGYMVRVGAVPREFSAAEYLRRCIEDADCRYFIVTDWTEWERQPDLQAALARYVLLARIEGSFAIYRLQ